MRTVFLGSIALIVLTSSVAANAADMAVKAPPIPEPPYNWSGPYVGANFGGAWTGGNLNIPNNNFYGGLTEFIAGIQAGYNFQAGNFLFGVEGDFDGTTFGHPALPTPTLGSVRQNWVGTIAGRAGIVEDRWLVYGKVGGGWVHSNAVLNFLGVSWTGSTTSPGWLAGAGVEYGFKSHWTLKLEYDYLARSSWTSVIFPPIQLNRDLQMVKFGANYKFESGLNDTVEQTRPGYSREPSEDENLAQNHRTQSPTSSAFRSKATRISTRGRLTAPRKCSTYSPSYRCASMRTGT
jgi:opacity protein-like surface antigen